VHIFSFFYSGVGENPLFLAARTKVGYNFIR